MTGTEGLGLGSCGEWGLRDLAHLEHQNDVKIETFRIANSESCDNLVAVGREEEEEESGSFVLVF